MIDFNNNHALLKRYFELNNLRKVLLSDLLGDFSWRNLLRQNTTQRRRVGGELTLLCINQASAGVRQRIEHRAHQRHRDQHKESSRTTFKFRTMRTNKKFILRR